MLKYVQAAGEERFKKYLKKSIVNLCDAEVAVCWWLGWFQVAYHEQGTKAPGPFQGCIHTASPISLS